MGQYYMIVNLDKRQYIHPHRFGDGLKLLEFGYGGNTMCALAVLLSDGNGRGGGDLDNAEDHEIVGSWAGDRIVVAGDYADPGNWLDDIPREELQKVAEEHYTEAFQTPEHVVLYSYAQHRFEDVSDLAARAMLCDEYLAAKLSEAAQFHQGIWDGEDGPLAPCLKALTHVGVNITTNTQ